MVWAGQPACVHREPRTEGNSWPILDQFQMARDSVGIMISLPGTPPMSICAVNQRPCLTPSEDHGYLLDEAEVVFWGICPTCQASTDNDHTKPIRYEEAR